MANSWRGISEASPCSHVDTMAWYLHVNTEQISQGNVSQCLGEIFKTLFRPRVCLESYIPYMRNGKGPQRHFYFAVLLLFEDAKGRSLGCGCGPAPLASTPTPEARLFKIV